MAESSLQDRLRDHAKAFDGLLSLIPAKMYYGDDTNDQWKKKKQTKAQAAEARRNKLDPDSALNRSVKEVMEEQAQKKRKRDQGLVDSENEWSDIDGVEAEKPGQGLKKKKQKTVVEAEPEMTEKERRKEEKKEARKARKAERQELRDEEAEYQRRNVKSGVNKVKLGPRIPKSESNESSHRTQPQTEQAPGTAVGSDEDEDEVEQSHAEDIDVSGLAAGDDEDKSDSAATSPSEPESPVFDTNGTPADSTGQAPSTSTSISSTIPPSEKPKHIKIPTDTTALRARLATRIQALRDARKADGPDGKPIRTRQELIESRRQKQQERKAHKKDLRQKAKEEEDQKREEALASARNSPGSILSPAVDLADNNFAFGRVAFGDGTQLSHDLTHTLTSGKKKGPSDPKTALQKFQNEKKRLEAMGEEKREDVEDKEAWLAARKRAEGERIRDDEKLLKKAVKRKEATKKKSEKAWAERADGVNKSMKQRQQKREANIKQRKEEKMMGKAGKKKKGGAKKSKGRAGFEGSFSVGGKRK
ncbi:surfeit locus protein 6-domain-containing protein [Xylariales sp. AK1849]|nr:surfeit locus protein 6-domain-containing protein [Xylariales sp. AK1849]